MKQPPDGAYAPGDVALASLSMKRTMSVWADQDAVARGAAIASGMISRREASEEARPRLAGMCSRLLADNPRRAVARMAAGTSMSERLRAVAAMGETAGEAFSDGMRADIGDARLMRSVEDAIRRQGPGGALWPRIERSGSFALARLEFPCDAQGLAADLAHAISSGGRCMVVCDARDDRPVLHLGGRGSIKSHLVDAADAIASPANRFVLSNVVGRIHPMAWSVLQPTFNPGGPLALKAPTPIRTRTRSDEAVRSYRNVWRNAARISRAFMEDDHNEICRAKESRLPLPEGMPEDRVMRDVEWYASAVAPAMTGYLDHLRSLSVIERRIADWG